MKTLLSIGEDFFRTILTDEECNIEHTTLSVVKKTETILYESQTALSQAIQKIYYQVHRRIQENPDLDTCVEPEIIFASTMSALLSDVVASVT
ncbi:hypothetical protein AYI69_g10275 [Smittium culicis]|uniref:Uncharacterized protein n=1 Tax=Smittium culicis TaxID=133412 RepID=A0A1R1X6Y6_9FUNG|nr:hypothetical protein AYI69_g10275 [Smittium culicis]